MEEIEKNLDDEEFGTIEDIFQNSRLDDYDEENDLEELNFDR